MNRKERRKLGFTEQRFRKKDMRSAGWNMKLYNIFHSYTKGEMGILQNSTEQRTNRIDGEPRNWEVERQRRNAK